MNLEININNGINIHNGSLGTNIASLHSVWAWPHRQNGKHWVKEKNQFQFKILTLKKVKVGTRPPYRTLQKKEKKSYYNLKHRKNCECCPGHYLSTSVYQCLRVSTNLNLNRCLCSHCSHCSLCLLVSTSVYQCLPVSTSVYQHRFRKYS